MSAARARIHAMFQLDEHAEQELDARLDDVRAEALREAKVEVVAWLVKKAREGNDPIGSLASKVDRGAVRIFLGTGHYRDAMDEHRSEVLAEAAAFVGNSDDCDCGGCDTCYARKLAAGLLAMAGAEATALAEPDMPECVHCRNRSGPWQPTGGRYSSGAQKFECAGGCGEEATATAATATPTAESTSLAPKWPAGWEHVLDTAIRMWGGEWDTRRVQRLYSARYGRGLFRSHARDCLSRRAHQGLMTLHDQDPNHRFYTLTDRKDVRP